jgi:3-phenylpropionate/cinnamic acid dioxygenase small subunit
VDRLEELWLKHELEEFLFLEAALLDDRRFEEWVSLFSDDLEYWMPVRSTRLARDAEHEFAQFGEGAFFDDDKASMEQRVRKLRTGYAWSEDPPSRVRHFISNVRILERPDDGSIRLSCNFLIYRSRLEVDEDWWVGRREDVVSRTGESWQIVKRHIFLDQVVLDSKNLSSFF